MTRERENELLAKRSDLRRRMRNLIQKIVDARMRGERDEAAIEELATLSRCEVELTKPRFEAA